jgi:DNA-binding protein WhiA
MGILEARLEKELNNKVNRRCNCDDANISKVVEAAQEQLNAIHILRELGLMDKLPAKLKQAAVARENNPESSLSELAALMDPPITKPAMNQRLKKMMEFAREAQK